MERPDAARPFPDRPEPPEETFGDGRSAGGAADAGDGAIDLEHAVARIGELPSTTSELETLIGKTHPEIRRLLEEEFGAEFLGPVVVNPKDLD
ncbi:MAG: hypothetical protein ACLFSZ_06585 [Puniceicoccaceae bacterium]